MSNKYFLIDRMFSNHDRYLLKKLLDKVNEVDAEGDEAVVDIESLTSTVQSLIDNPATEQLGIDTVAGSTTKYLSEKGTMEELPVPEPTGAIEVTYAELTALIAANELVAGQKYVISDYQTVHTIPSTTDTNTGDVEPLLVTAVAPNKLAPEAYSAAYPQDVIYYSPANDQEMVPGCTKGYIYRRVDTKQNNDIPFDFRQVKFRRWQISQPTWDAATTYSKGSVVKSTGNDSLWVSLQDDNLNKATSDAAYWRQFEWYNLSYVSPGESSWNPYGSGLSLALNYTTLYQDYKMWANAADYDTSYSNKLEGNLSNLLVSSNTVIFGAFFNSNSIGSNFSSNSIGEAFGSNTIGSNFYSNSIESNFSSNSIGAVFYANSIKSGFGYNVIMSSFYSNSIGSGFSSNVIGSNFSSNVIGSFFSSNSIGSNFYSNSIGANFNSNSIGSNFNSNSIGSNFYANSIESNFSSNSIGSYFNSNSIGSYFSSNSIGVGFQNNSIGAVFSNKNLTAVAELYDKSYPHEIFRAASGYVITWYDATGTQQKTYTA